MVEAARTTAEREQRSQGQTRPGASAPAADEAAMASVAAPSLSAAPGDPGQSGSRQAAILRDPRLHGAGPAQRARIVRQLQRSLGNSQVEQALARSGAPAPALRRATLAVHAPDSRVLAPEEAIAAGYPAAARPAAGDEPESAGADSASSEQAPTSKVLDSGQGASTTPDPAGVAPTAISLAHRVQRSWFGDAVGSVAGAIADPKQLLLGKVADFARGLPGYALLTQILGKDPISDRPVERSAKGVFQAVLTMVPGGDQIFANLNESGAIDKAFAWLSEQWAKLGLTWDTIKGLFKRAWEALSAGDLLNPLGAWEKLKAIFLEPLGRLKRFVVAIGEKVLEFIFEGVMEKLGGGQVLAVLKRVGDAFTHIIKDPIGFLGNLIRGVGEGLRNFAGNILRHLGKGLVGWLFGELAAGGIELPKSFDLKGILTLVTSVLGLAWQTIRAQAVKRFGEPAVKQLESGAKGAFQLFSIIKERGLGGVWELIKEQIGNLKDLVFDGIKEMVAGQVIQAGVQWLIGILGGPAGAVVKAVKMIYDVVVWFIDNRERMVALFNGIVDSITAIAGGAVGQAAKYIEGTLAGAIPMVLSFLARLLGLGNLSQRIRGIIEKVQAPVKKAIGWVLDKAKGWVKKLAAGGKKAWGKLKDRLGFKQKPPRQRLEEGLRLGVATVNKLKGKPLIGEAILRPLLQGIRVAKGLSLLEPFVKGKVWAVRGDVQRVEELESTVPVAAPGPLTPITLTPDLSPEDGASASTPADAVGPADTQSKPPSEEPDRLLQLDPNAPTLLVQYWRDRIVQAPEKKDKFEEYIANIQSQGRPTPYQAEEEWAFLRAHHLGGESDMQTTYLSGRQVSGRPKGSTRPDIKDPTNALIEVKRYKVENISKLIHYLKTQIINRAGGFDNKDGIWQGVPYEHRNRQAIIVDFRGQEDKVTPELVADLKQRIVDAVNEAAKDKGIRFELSLGQIEVFTW